MHDFVRFFTLLVTLGTCLLLSPALAQTQMTAEEVAHVVIRAHDNFTVDPEQIINAFSDDARIEYPFAPADIPGFPKVIEGKEVIRK
ncbi:MAG: hypothetical protein IT497_11045 [Ottowia sp.]|nr:hypothetical protein [Ottowia sp.]